MGSYTINVGEIAAHNKQLAADTADTVSFAYQCSKVEVLSDGTAAMYFTADGTAATVGGAHCYKLPSGAASAVIVESFLTGGNSAVSLISSGTPTYSVTRAD